MCVPVGSTHFDFFYPLYPSLPTQELVLEKETRIRESMYMMGLSQWVLWSTWYLKQFILLFISAFVMTLLLKVRMYSVCS